MWFDLGQEPFPPEPLPCNPISKPVVLVLGTVSEDGCGGGLELFLSSETETTVFDSVLI